MKKWWALYVNVPWDQRIVWSALMLALIPLGLATLRPGPPPPAAESGVDTHIPRGFVLVPIDADNYESLDSILGRYGWVDLFQGGEDGAPRRLVARNVRLLRAPNNPAHFAVLVPERRAADILKVTGSFTVVVKPPGGGGMELVNQERMTTPPTRRRITYEGK